MQRRRAPRRLIVFSVESSASASSAAFALHASLLFRCAGMPVRIAEVCLAEPAITPFAILGGDNHARLVPGRNALAEYPARLIFFFACSFSSADAIPESQLTNSSSRSLRKRLPTAALHLCFCSVGRRFRPSHAPKLSGLSRTLSCRPDRKNCSGAWLPPHCEPLFTRILGVRPVDVNPHQPLKSAR